MRTNHITQLAGADLQAGARRRVLRGQDRHWQLAQHAYRFYQHIYRLRRVASSSLGLICSLVSTSSLLRTQEQLRRRTYVHQTQLRASSSAFCAHVRFDLSGIHVDLEPLVRCVDRSASSRASKLQRSVLSGPEVVKDIGLCKTRHS